MDKKELRYKKYKSSKSCHQSCRNEVPKLSYEDTMSDNHCCRIRICASGPTGDQGPTGNPSIFDSFLFRIH